MLIALASLNPSWENKTENLLACGQHFRKAKSLNAELIIFPEMTLTGFSMNIGVTAEEKDSSPTFNSFSELSSKYEIGVVYGVVFRQNLKATNNAIFLNKSGEIIGLYKKIHPFSFSGEDKYFEGGEEILSVSFGSLRIGVTICYDLRFPEIYSALGVTSDLIINIANWPEKRIEHWITLLKARAIENQVFIAGVNRIGNDQNSLDYVRSSIVVKPNGDVLEPKFSIGNLDIFEIDQSFISKLRSQFSTTQDRRPDLYKRIL
jgi:omega-amidase